MKKLFTLLSLFVVIGMSANVFAQSSTGSAPYPGAMHNYSVNGGTNNGSSFTWDVLDASSSSVVGSIATISAVGSGAKTDATVNITWAATAVPGTEYIVVVEETDASGCKNSKGLPVIITQSAFDLIVVNGGNACYENSVEVTWSGGQAEGDVTYDHGTAEVTYTVKAEGVGATETWQFTPGVAFTQTDIVATTVTVKDETSNVVSESAGVYSLTGPQTVTITVVVDNNNIYNNGSAANAQDFTATLSLTNVAAGTGAVESDATNNSDNLSVSRPNTSQITTN
ncbi:hypothetical protein [Sunxiuqinia elliptica]|uniref:Calx-beta domain-containing protein n=1 Tax=Sunxiuqinia elliptica TaxID=655355 RepID=A0A4R6H7P5_9BACT|nr:hypothetical protein [Sunxiuqinia elliptica]TDO04044.1 hypothetical protein DET52_102384 [Sunxiuqinia elliptica]TDO62326.1 hypothetical protein DET65_2061 [Sunxiuqinia elliptica]